MHWNVRLPRAIMKAINLPAVPAHDGGHPRGMRIIPLIPRSPWSVAGIPGVPIPFSPG